MKNHMINFFVFPMITPSLETQPFLQCYQYFHSDISQLFTQSARVCSEISPYCFSMLCGVHVCTKERARGYLPVISRHISNKLKLQVKRIATCVLCVLKCS